MKGPHVLPVHSIFSVAEQELETMSWSGQGSAHFLSHWGKGGGPGQGQDTELRERVILHMVPRWGFLQSLNSLP